MECLLGCLVELGPQIVLALLGLQARGNLSPVEEVAHEAIALGPIVTEHAVVVGAEGGISSELKTARGADAHEA